MSGFGFGPGGIDCEDVLRDVYLYLDDETDESAKNRIRQHLDGCAPCLKQFGLEQDVRSLIARCCGLIIDTRNVFERKGALSSNVIKA